MLGNQLIVLKAGKNKSQAFIFTFLLLLLNCTAGNHLMGDFSL